MISLEMDTGRSSGPVVLHAGCTLESFGGAFKNIHVQVSSKDESKLEYLGVGPGYGTFRELFIYMYNQVENYWSRSTFTHLKA